MIFCIQFKWSCLSVCPCVFVWDQCLVRSTWISSMPVTHSQETGEYEMKWKSTSFSASTESIFGTLCDRWSFLSANRTDTYYGRPWWASFPLKFSVRNSSHEWTIWNTIRIKLIRPNFAKFGVTFSTDCRISFQLQNAKFNPVFILNRSRSNFMSSSWLSSWSDVFMTPFV